MNTKINLFWFRRDLRLDDNHGLFKALQAGQPVLPVFIFDKNILDALTDKNDKRVQFIHQCIENLQEKLVNIGSSITVIHDSPENAFRHLIAQYQIGNVFTNHDYEKYGINRDKEISEFLQQHHIDFFSFKDQVIFEKSEVVKDDGKPYTVFTPYSRKWKATLINHPIETFNCEKYFDHFIKIAPTAIPTLKEIGFHQTSQQFPSMNPDAAIIQHYAQKRDIPSIQGTSKLGIHLRFGTISIRKLATTAAGLSETFLNELIWRDFYHMICWQFPHINDYKSFKSDYDLIEWRNNEDEFKQWCMGNTGYPIVDAGMRELNETGFMHNRVRMIVASFLCKHLLIDWRWGEAYFAQKLLDFDFASNNGGWQWAAGCGCDAAPYFRIFNPYLQTQKFDKDLIYIKKWVSEFQEFSYPKPIVVHELARKRCLEVYGKYLKK
jgi:deoxyribodipyrimidine photo-lyase